MKSLRPPRPTIRDERVARRIAERLVTEVNLDEVYWTREELPDRIWDVLHEIMSGGNPSDVFHRLHLKQKHMTEP